jgi:hypothetical protein
MWTAWIVAALAVEGWLPVQGELWAANGAPVTGTHTLTVQILDAPDLQTSPAPLAEQEVTVALIDGVFSANLLISDDGGASPSLFAQGRPLWISVGVDGAAGSAPVPVGVTPRALWAANVPWTGVDGLADGVVAALTSASALELPDLSALTLPLAHAQLASLEVLGDATFSASHLGAADADSLTVAQGVDAASGAFVVDEYGAVTATSFSGSGASLTDIPAAAVAGLTNVETRVSALESVASPTAGGLVSTYVPSDAASILVSAQARSAGEITVATHDGYRTVLASASGATAQTVRLPLASANVGRSLMIRKTGTGTGDVRIVTSGVDPLNGSSGEFTLYAPDGRLEVLSDGARWMITDHYEDINLQGIAQDTNYQTGSGTSLNFRIIRIRDHITLSWYAFNTSAQSSSHCLAYVSHPSLMRYMPGQPIGAVHSVGSGYGSLSDPSVDAGVGPSGFYAYAKGTGYTYPGAYCAFNAGTISYHINVGR